PRIISQSPYITDMLDYLGMKQCIVGVSRYSKHNLPHTGGILDPDAEAINSLMPDLFITSTWTKLKTVSAVTPEETKVIRLSSFNKMAQLEQNMNTIIKATGWQQSIPKVSAFSKSWREKVKLVKGNNKKVLLLSSCSGTPYSFGPNSRLYDLFTQAGFNVVETGKKIRHIRSGNEIEDMTALLDRFQPELLFVFEQKLKKQCQLLLPKVPVRILNFDGNNFLHPSTKIIEGLDSLITKNHYWQ
ncbi:MAG: ABC transporter substrate-binding protein, partial [Gammaproteobacteria bacterium]|nr:ABC transporter substrate-binding protein [Gammaproteobacteria bacterium]